MPMWLHVLLAIIITVYFLFRFIKEKQIYELLFVFWVPSTLLQYISTNATFTRVVGIFQVIMFILVVYFMFRKRGYRRHKTAEILAKYSTGDLDDAVVASNENLEAQEPQEQKKDDGSL
ncbi:MAG: hypothetical protein WAX04_06215 [Oscillospiraceae bacterium]